MQLCFCLSFIKMETTNKERIRVKQSNLTPNLRESNSTTFSYIHLNIRWQIEHNLNTPQL